WSSDVCSSDLRAGHISPEDIAARLGDVVELNAARGLFGRSAAEFDRDLLRVLRAGDEAPAGGCGIVHAEPIYLELRIGLVAPVKGEERHQVALGAADILAGRVPRHPGRDG